jgi:phytanoyl-CoA hydroxylase
MNVVTPKDIPQFKDDLKSALKFYKENGYHIELGLYSDDECGALIKEAERFDNYKNGSMRPQMMPHRQSDVFLNALKKASVVDIMSKLCGGKVVGIQSEFFYGKPSVRGFSLHQDNFYVEAGDDVFASAWAALIDVSEEKGSLILYPGSHKEGKLPTRKLDMPEDKAQDPNANDQETIVPEKYKPFNVIVPKGAAVFIHGNVVHGSNRNSTDEYRYVLLNTYIKKGESFRPGNYAQRQEVELSESY